MAKSAKQLVPVTERALIQRINRRLRHDGERLMRTREGSNAEVSVGRFCILDIQKNAICYTHIDLEELGRELGVLAPYESLQDQES